MGKLFSFAGSSIIGAITSALTAAIVLLLADWLDFNLFTLMLWFVIPAGALICGMGAASGYYLGARLFNVQATGTLLLSMVVIAGATQFLIYWTQYATFALEDGRMLSEVLPFSAYLQLVLTKTEYGFGTHGSSLVSTELGLLGYGVAFLQFLGFMAGGFAVYAFLSNIPYCDGCASYRKKLAKREKAFETVEQLCAWLAELRTENQVTAAYSAKIGFDAPVGEPAAMSGAVADFTLFECPACRAQTVTEQARLWNQNKWAALPELARRVNSTGPLH